MNPLRVRALVSMMLMLLAFGVAQAWRPHARLADSRPRIELESLFPKTFGEWKVDTSIPVQLVSPDTQAMLDKIYNSTLSRTYVNALGERIMLSVAYGGDQSDATRAHRPEVCYPAQGFQISSAANGQIQLADRNLPVRQLVARAGGRVEPITYWITVGDRITVSGTQQKLAQLSYSTRGVIPDGMLVRVSTIGDDAGRGYAIHRQFILDLAKALPQSQGNLVVGKPAA